MNFKYDLEVAAYEELGKELKHYLLWHKKDVKKIHSLFKFIDVDAAGHI